MDTMLSKIILRLNLKYIICVHKIWHRFCLTDNTLMEISMKLKYSPIVQIKISILSVLAQNFFTLSAANVSMMCIKLNGHRVMSLISSVDLNQLIIPLYQFYLIYAIFVYFFAIFFEYLIYSTWTTDLLSANHIPYRSPLKY